MKIFSRFSLTICLSFFIINYSEAQFMHYTQNGAMDNALSYSRLIIQKTEGGVYKQVGVFKVVGTSYLFGEKNKGNLFSPEAKAYNIFLSYNTYNQEVEFYSSGNPDKPLVKEPRTVDSFLIQENISLGINHPLKFVYGTHLGSSEKFYFLEIYAGPQYSIYKRYKSDLGYVATNYVQSDLRQFDLLYDYYYTDSGKGGPKKIKANSSSIIKEFKNIKDISPVFTNEAFATNQEEALRVAFEYLNK
ncbi:MAG TPA: hypothetical protein VK483_10080 [Chitinophagaceae bacterium]|nr:hypothetical protein [Chitinophagaceae bacterium]